MKKKPMQNEDNEYKARKSVIEAMRDMAKAEMGGKLSGLKKVTVAADNKEDLSKGLDKAKELVAKTPGNGMEEESSEEECEVCGMHACRCEPKEEKESEDESEEGEDESETAFANMSPEELDKQLEMLMALKAKMKS